MRHSLSVLFAASLSLTLTLPAFADDTSPTEADARSNPGRGAPIAPSASRGLANVHGGTRADGAGTAGRAADVALTSASNPTASRARPAPTPRTLRRMSTDRVVASLAIEARACASENMTPSPVTVEVRVSVAPSGEVESAVLASDVKVPSALGACLVKTVSGARFGAPGAQGASIVLPVTVPGRAIAAAPAAAAPPAEDAAPAATPVPQELVAAKP